MFLRFRTLRSSTKCDPEQGVASATLKRYAFCPIRPPAGGRATTLTNGFDFQHGDWGFL